MSIHTYNHIYIYIHTLCTSTEWYHRMHQDLCTGQLDSHSDVLSVAAGDAAARLASGAADGTVTLWRNAEEEGPEDGFFQWLFNGISVAFQ